MAGAKTTLEPDAEQMLAHVQYLYGSLNGCDDGLIELAYGAAKDGAIVGAYWFPTNRLDAMIECAVERNNHGCNVYISAALRKPGTAPFGRGTDADFYALPAPYADLDTNVAAAREAYRRAGCPPTAVVITGRVPHQRAQLWWKLTEPLRDPDLCRAQNAAIAAALGGDPAVVNPGRVMRLGGSIAHPHKLGRVVELTTFQVLNGDGRPPLWTPVALAAAFPLGSGQTQASSGDGPGLGGGARKPDDHVDQLIAASKVKEPRKLWHESVVKLVAHLVGKGTPPAAIIAMAECLTLDGYTVAKTRVELQEMIDGAIAKGWDEPGENAPTEDGEDAPTEAGERTRVIGGILKTVTTIERINAQYAMLDAPGEPRVIVDRADARPIPLPEFKLRTADQVIVIPGRDENGQPVKKPKPAFTVWLASSKRHRYRRIVFTSGAVADDAMNLFRGFGVTARQGACGLILRHIAEVICAGDDAASAAMLDLIAWQMQHVGTPSRIIVDLISEEEQTGKGSFAEKILLKVWGAAGHMTHTIADVAGDFNDVLRGKAFVVLDEALFAGDHRAANMLKGLAATETVSINTKNMPRCRVPAGLNFWTLSNERVPVFIGEGDVRHWPLQVDPCRQGDRAYWTALHHEIEHGGCEAFLWEMLHRDVAGFVPQRDVPRQNDTHAAIVEANLNPGDPRKWLEACLSAEHLLCVRNPNAVSGKDDGYPWAEGVRIRPQALLAGYYEWVRGLRGHSIRTVRPGDLWKVLTAVGCDAERADDGRWRIIPTCDSALAALEKLARQSKPQTGGTS